MADFVDPGTHYRRGVILGLTLAELFTVLVFLLLLVLGAYVLIQDERVRTGKKLVDDYRRVLVRVLKPEGNEIVPALPSDLRARGTGGDNGRPSDGLTTDTSSAGGTPEPVEQPASGSEDSVSDANRSRDQQIAIDSLTQMVADQQGQIDSLSDSVRLAAIADSLIAVIDSLRRVGPPSDPIRTDDPKGQDSPCWFRPAKRANGEPYERPTYIFHIRIADERVFVQDIPAPTPVYQEAKRRLPFDRGALNRSLSDDEFVTAFQPLKLAGDSREVREDRRCTFYVAVWDATSETSKRRYKRAHNEVVQAVFNTYEYRQDPWPHQDGTGKR